LINVRTKDDKCLNVSEGPNILTLINCNNFVNDCHSPTPIKPKNSTQHEVGVTRLLVCNPPPPPHTNFYTTSKQPRKLIFGIRPYFNPTR
jgi:hypothetical protein